MHINFVASTSFGMELIEICTIFSMNLWYSDWRLFFVEIKINDMWCEFFLLIKPILYFHAKKYSLIDLNV